MVFMVPYREGPDREIWAFKNWNSKIFKELAVPSIWKFFMTDVIDEVKSVLKLYEASAVDAEAQGRPALSERHINKAKALKAIIDEVETLRMATRPVPLFNGQDISDLPEELLQELNITKTDKIEEQLFAVINAAQGQADIDTILIGLFRNFDVKLTRKYAQNRLWRMVQKDMLFSVPDKKGWYSTKPIKDELDEELEELLGSASSTEEEQSQINQEHELDDDIPF